MHESQMSQGDEQPRNKVFAMSGDCLARLIGRYTFYRDFKRKVRQLGAKQFLLHLPAHIFWKVKYEWQRKRTRSSEDRQFDHAYGVETRRSVRTAALDISDDLLRDVVGYEASPPDVLRAILDCLPHNYREFTFVDIGAGKGRAVLVAAQYGFKEVVGVEISARLSQVARRNMRSFQRRFQHPVSWSIVTMDARDYCFPGQNLVVYLYNPCAAEMLRTIRRNIEAAAAKTDTEVIVVYYWPRFRAVFDESRLLKVWKEAPDYVIYYSEASAISAQRSRHESREQPPCHVDPKQSISAPVHHWHGKNRMSRHRTLTFSDVRQFLPIGGSDHPCRPLRPWFLHPCILLCFLVNMVAAARQSPDDVRALQRLLPFPGITLSYKWPLGLDPAAEPSYELLPPEKLKTLLAARSNDPQLYLQLGRSYQVHRNGREANEAFKKAAALYRKQIATTPPSAELLIEASQAFKHIGKTEDAERALRRALSADDPGWRPYAELGRVLTDRAFETIGFDITNKLWLSKRRPNDRETVRAKDLSGQALACFNQAVALSPNEPAPLQARAMFHSKHHILLGLFHSRSTNKEDSATLAGNAYSQEFFADLSSAAKLQPEPHQRITTLLWLNIVSAVPRLQELPHAATHLRIWDALPESMRTYVSSAIDDLTAIAKTNGPSQAAALESVGVIQLFIFRYVPLAEATLRRAVELDPSRDGVWDLLIDIINERHDHDKVLDICSQRLTAKECARNHFMVAKAYHALGQHEKAEQHLTQALELDPDDFYVNLGLAAVLLRRSNSPAILKRTDKLLRKAYSRISTTASTTAKIDYMLATSVWYALAGNNTKALTAARQVLRWQPSEEHAAAILAQLSKQSDRRIQRRAKK